jgi:hypothetical protein
VHPECTFCTYWAIWGVSVEWFLVSVLYCWFVCHHTAALVGVRQQKLCIASGWKRLVSIFVWRHCHRLHVAPLSFVLVLLLLSIDRLSSSSCPLLVRSKACVGSIDRPFVFVVKTAFCFHRQDVYTFVDCCFVFVMESSLPWSLRSDRSLFLFSLSSRIRRLHAYTTFDRSCVVFVHYIHKPACVFVVVVVDITSSWFLFTVDNASSWFLFTCVRVSKNVVTLCSYY